ncbi:MAG: DoxX-like family protein [Thermoanaerobaculia bacterium]
MRQTLVHGVARVGLALIFVYQGLVPKLTTRHADEIAMLRDAGIAPDVGKVVLTALGLSEVLLGASLLLAWQRRRHRRSVQP